MSSDPDLGPVELAILGRITEARAEYLRRTGTDLPWSEIGRQLGWSQTGTSHVKTGQRAVRLRELPPLAGLLGVRVEWLAFGSGPMRATAASGGRAELPPEPETVVAVRPIPQRKPAARRRAR